MAKRAFSKNYYPYKSCLKPIRLYLDFSQNLLAEKASQILKKRGFDGISEKSYQIIESEKHTQSVRPENAQAIAAALELEDITLVFSKTRHNKGDEKSALGRLIETNLFPGLGKNEEFRHHLEDASHQSLGLVQSERTIRMVAEIESRSSGQNPTEHELITEFVKWVSKNEKIRLRAYELLSEKIEVERSQSKRITELETLLDSLFKDGGDNYDYLPIELITLFARLSNKAPSLFLKHSSKERAKVLEIEKAYMSNGPWHYLKRIFLRSDHI